MSATKPLSEIYWDNLSHSKKTLLMRKYSVLSYSRKAIDRIYRSEHFKGKDNEKP